MKASAMSRSPSATPAAPSPDRRLILDKAMALAVNAGDPETLIAAPMRLLRDGLGDVNAAMRAENLPAGQSDFRVAGGFLRTPSGEQLMLVGNSGFPAEQARLCIPVDGGHPGRVMASRQPLLLEDTRRDSGFRQYLQTARMGSALYAPLLIGGDAVGIIIIAALAATSFGPEDLEALSALAPVVAARWQDLGGAEWIAAEHAAAMAAGRVQVSTTK